MHRNRATDKIEVNGRGGGGGTEGIQTSFLTLKACMMSTYSVMHFSAGRKYIDVSLTISDNLSHRRDMMNGTMAGRGLAAVESEFCTVGDSRTSKIILLLLPFLVMLRF